MATAKEAILHILEQQPDDSSYDELLEELAFKKMIDLGLADVDSGKTIANEVMSEKINSWQICRSYKRSAIRHDHASS